MVNCIITGDTITSSNDSKAHVIPSALGGRLKPPAILSDNGNEILNDKADLPIIRAFQPLMTLLDESRDRGKNPPVVMTDEAGKTYNVAFNQPLTLKKPEFSMVPIGSSDADGVNVSISARTRKEARTLLGQVKKKYPNFDIEEAMQRAALVQTPLIGMLGTQLQVGPSVIFPAAFAAASIFAVYNGLPGHPQLKEYVSDLDPDMIPVLLPPDTFYWYPPVDALSSSTADVTHLVALIANAERAEALVYIEYFNISCVGVRLPYYGNDDRIFSDAVDVLTGNEVAANVDLNKIFSIPWSATHMVGDATLYEETTQRTGRIVGLAQQRNQKAAVGNIVNEVLGPADGRPFTEHDINRLGAKLAEFFVARYPVR
jgi:hypothetical protein